MDTTTILQLATILAVVGSFFGLYRLLVSQKNATIESLKQQLELMRAESESVVAKALDERIIIMEHEIERLRDDNNKLAEQTDQFEKWVIGLLVSGEKHVQERLARYGIKEYEIVQSPPQDESE